METIGAASACSRISLLSFYGIRSGTSKNKQPHSLATISSVLQSVEYWYGISEPWVNLGTSTVKQSWVKVPHKTLVRRAYTYVAITVYLTSQFILYYIHNMNCLCSWVRWTQIQCLSFILPFTSKMGSLQIDIKYIKSPARILIIWLQTDTHESDLSNEIL